jgi:hypothetical protein
VLDFAGPGFARENDCTRCHCRTLYTPLCCTIFSAALANTPTTPTPCPRASYDTMSPRTPHRHAHTASEHDLKKYKTNTRMTRTGQSARHDAVPRRAPADDGAAEQPLLDRRQHVDVVDDADTGTSTLIVAAAAARFRPRDSIVASVRVALTPLPLYIHTILACASSNALFRTDRAFFSTHSSALYSPMPRCAGHESVRART